MARNNFMPYLNYRRFNSTRIIEKKTKPSRFVSSDSRNVKSALTSMYNWGTKCALLEICKAVTFAVYLTTKRIPCLWFVRHDKAWNNVHADYTLLNENNNIWHETIFPVLELQEICQYKDHRKKTKPSRFVSSDSKMFKYNSAALTFTVFNSYLHYLHLKGNFFNKPIHLGIMRREKPHSHPNSKFTLLPWQRTFILN